MSQRNIGVIWLLAAFLHNGGGAAGLEQRRALARLPLAPGVRGLAGSSDVRACPKVAFLKIQKTGSSALGDAIMPNLARMYGQRNISEHHHEFNYVSREAPGCVVTVLRDPVERFFSEFTMLRSKAVLEGPGELTQDQWDWHADDLMELRAIQALPMPMSMSAYLLSPNNPSRNRQALYLLGFDRVACRATCCGVCSNETRKGAKGGYPAHAYSWDRDHDGLLARAKRNLMGLRAYGITECFPKSMRVIGSAMGWNPDITEFLGSSIHLREQDKSKLALNLLGLPSKAAHHSGSSGGSWRHFVPPELEAQIRAVNRVDDELYRFARQQFSERYGIQCSDA